MPISSTPSLPEAQEANVVIVDWNDLVSCETIDDRNSNAEKQSLSQALSTALGPTGTGIIAIRNVPGFVEAKRAFLPMAHTLAHLPPHEQRLLEDPDSLYNAGWSHGKEQVGGTTPDLSKGSFYFNPVTDMVDKTATEQEQFPTLFPPNKWPQCIPGFKDKACTIGKIMTKAALKLACHIDAMCSSSGSSNKHSLEEALRGTDKVQARLLYYFPQTSETDTTSTAEDAWFGWHNDSGFFTVLAGDLYVNDSTGEPLIDCPDPAGLYVSVRGYGTTEQTVLKVTIPGDCLAIQMGECAQIMSGGIVRATPHCVRGCSSSGVARISLPCFVGAQRLTSPLLRDSTSNMTRVFAASEPNHPRVPPLQQRWEVATEKMLPVTFGSFLQTCFEQYYTWNKK